MPKILVIRDERTVEPAPLKIRRLQYGGEVSATVTALMRLSMSRVAQLRTRHGTTTLNIAQLRYLTYQLAIVKDTSSRNNRLPIAIATQTVKSIRGVKVGGVRCSVQFISYILNMRESFIE